jgi:hypothetical protein
MTRNGGLKHKNFFSHSSADLNSEIKASAEPQSLAGGSGECFLVS